MVSSLAGVIPSVNSGARPDEPITPSVNKVVLELDSNGPLMFRGIEERYLYSSITLADSEVFFPYVNDTN